MAKEMEPYQITNVQRMTRDREMKKSSVTTVWIFSALFLVLALLGFISDSLPVERAFFETNTILNLTHLITAIGFAVVTKQGVDASIHLIRVFGSAYTLISAIGFMGMNIQIEEQWSYDIYVNFLNYAQFGLGVTLYTFGSILKNSRRLAVA
jgi:heme/copper-type cytochrome/quinol oxidase subunit 4